MSRADALGFSLLAVLLGQWLIFDLSYAGVLIPVAVFLCLILDGVFRPASPFLMPVVTRGSAQGSQVALSFDDGPDANTTPAILDLLGQANARASFFCIGRKLAEHPELARRIHAEGHEIGNHSFDHARTLNFARDAKMQHEILRGAEAVKAVTGLGKMPLYRPPVGLKNPPLARVANKLGLKVVMWSIHGRDTRGAAAEKIAGGVLGRIRPGDIVLLHDGHDLPDRTRPEIVEAVRLILQGLQEKGLQAVTVSELIKGA